jgi:hypothetical protein
MAGKTVAIVLRDNLGTATFNAGTQKIDFPPGIPSSRFPKQGIKRKTLLASWKGLPSSEDRETSPVKILCFTHHFDAPVLPANENLGLVGDFSSSNEGSFSFPAAQQLFNVNVERVVSLHPPIRSCLWAFQSSPSVWRSLTLLLPFSTSIQEQGSACAHAMRRL